MVFYLKVQKFLADSKEMEEALKERENIKKFM